MRRKKTMAKKQTSTTTNLEEVVAPVKVEGVTPELVKVTEAKPEPIKRRTVIAKSAASFRSMPTMETKYIVGKMPIGVAYEIVQEIDTVIFGKFYKLSNGYYITTNGNYAVN